MVILHFNNIFLLFLLCCFLFLDSASSDSKTDELINDICRATTDYGFCYKVFHQNIKSPSTDIIGLSRITIDQGIINATNSLNYVGNLLRHEDDPNKQFLLIHCLYGYDGALGSFYIASYNLDRGNFVELLHSVRMGPIHMRKCLSIFAFSPVLGERNIIMSNLMTMAVITAINLNRPHKRHHVID
ncbi:hypothetical protein ACFE04_007876 [Oxalis oulophora]